MTLKKLLKNLKEEFKVGVKSEVGDGWMKIYLVASDKDIADIDKVADDMGEFRFIAYAPGKDLYVFPINLLHEEAAKKLKIDIYHGFEPVIAGVAHKRGGKWVCRSSFNYDDAISALMLSGTHKVSIVKEQGKRSGIYLDNVYKTNWGWADKYISITPYIEEQRKDYNIQN